MADWDATAEAIFTSLGGIRTRRGWKVHCPSHDDHEPSLDLEVKDDTLVFKCRVGCAQDAVLESLHSLDLWPKKAAMTTKSAPIVSPENLVATYTYIDPVTGEMLAKKLRYEGVRDGKRKKVFQWEDPDGNDGLPNGTDQLYPYNAGMAVTNHPESIVLVVEGEKVANTISFALPADEFVAISLSNGADSTWSEQNIELLRGRTVVVLPDEDDAGYRFLGRTLGALQPVADVSWCKLPGLGPKEDAADWFGAGHSVDEFRAAVTAGRQEAPAENELPTPEGKLPHNLDAERAILGAILLVQNDAFEAVQLEPSDFYPRAHQIVFQALSDLYEHGKPLGRNTVKDYLAGREQLAAVGGSAYLKTLEDAGKTHYAEYLQEQAALVRKASVRRQLIEAGEKVVGIGWDGKLDPDDAVQAAYDQVTGVASQHTSSDFADMPTLMGVVSDTLERLALHEGELIGMPTGFRRLDAATSGLQRGDLIILAARPSIGKTALGLNIAYNAASYGNRVAIFSVEMSREQIGQRLLTLDAHVDHHQIRTGKIAPEYGPRVRESLQRLGQMRLYVDDTASTVLEMKAKAKRLQREHGLDFLMVDYLQLMSGSTQARKFGTVSEVTEISKGLKGMARELDVPVLALSQLSREPEKRPDKHPMMSDLRESGAIEQDADLVMFLYRDDYYHPLDSDNPTEKPGTAELELAKHRNGPTEKFWLMFEKDQMRFRTMDHVDVLMQEETAA